MLKCCFQRKEAECNFPSLLLLVSWAQACSVETLTESVNSEVQPNLKSWTAVLVEERSTFTGVTMSTPEGHATLDGGAAVDCIGEVAALVTTETLFLRIRRIILGGDGLPIEASCAVSLPVTIGEKSRWLEACVLSGSTPRLVSRRWLWRQSRHLLLCLLASENCETHFLASDMQSCFLSQPICDSLTVSRLHILSMSGIDCDDAEK